MSGEARADGSSGMRWIAERVSASYLALPSSLIAVAVGAAFLVTALDGRLQLPSLVGIWGSDLDAGLILSTIAGSMITVAALVFSITMVVLTLTAQQYGHRIVRGVLADRTSQIVLGFFLATFVFCILSLALLHRPGDIGSVPTVTVAVAILLSIGGVVLLAVFVNHIMVNVRIGSVLASIQRTFEATAAAVYGSGCDADPAVGSEGTSDDDVVVQETDGPAEVADVRATSSGYVQLVRIGRLVEIARSRDVSLRVEVQPGDFVHQGQTVATARLQTGSSDDLDAAVRRAVVLGAERTPAQDLRLSLSQLQEVAFRALSPGINDPHTAVSAVGRIRACLLLLAGREEPRRVFADKDGRLRLRIPVLRFNELLGSTLGPLIPEASRSPEVLIEVLRTLMTLEPELSRETDRAALRGLADSVGELYVQITPSSARAAVRAEYARLMERLASGRPHAADRSEDSEDLQHCHADQEGAGDDL